MWQILRPFRQLISVALSNMPGVTLAGVDELPSLQSLLLRSALGQPPLEFDERALLAVAPKLRALQLENANVSDTVVVALSRMRLDYLDLSYTSSFTDAGLFALADSSLKYLQIAMAPHWSDDAVVSIVRRSRLHWLSLKDATPELMSRCREAARPGLSIMDY